MPVPSAGEPECLRLAAVSPCPLALCGPSTSPTSLCFDAAEVEPLDVTTVVTAHYPQVSVRRPLDLAEPSCRLGLLLLVARIAIISPDSADPAPEAYGRPQRH